MWKPTRPKLSGEASLETGAAARERRPCPRPGELRRQMKDAGGNAGLQKWCLMWLCFEEQSLWRHREIKGARGNKQAFYKMQEGNFFQRSMSWFLFWKGCKWSQFCTAVLSDVGKAETLKECWMKGSVHQYTMFHKKRAVGSSKPDPIDSKSKN